MDNALSQLAKDLAKKHKNIQIGLGHQDIEFLPTGSLELDVTMGTGGWPFGRVSILAGKESSGKSTLSLKAIANAQKIGKRAVYIDSEATFDKVWAEKLGVNVDDLLIVGNHLLEEAGEIAVDLAKSGAIDLLIFDSVAGVSIKPIEEGEFADAHIGRKAKMLGHLMTKITGPIWTNKVAAIFINQLRDNIQSQAQYPLPIMPGGHALPYASSMTVFLGSRACRPEDGVAEAVKDGSILITANVRKNKLAPPFGKTEFILRSDGTIDEKLAASRLLVDYAEMLDVEKSGSWLTLPKGFIEGEDAIKVQGANGILRLFEEAPESFVTTKEKILERLTR